MASCDDLRRAVASAEAILQKIGKKYTSEYHDVKMYLVFSSPHGQVDVGGSVESVVKEFPEMIKDDEVKDKAVAVIKKIRQLEGKSHVDNQRLRQELGALAPKLSYRDDVNIEIRFTSLEFELIWRLQVDDLVDRNLTPQSHASIRIVVGSIGALSKC